MVLQVVEGQGCQVVTLPEGVDLLVVVAVVLQEEMALLVDMDLQVVGVVASRHHNLHQTPSM